MTGWGDRGPVTTGLADKGLAGPPLTLTVATGGLVGGLITLTLGGAEGERTPVGLLKIGIKMSESELVESDSSSIVSVLSLY